MTYTNFKPLVYPIAVITMIYSYLLYLVSPEINAMMQYDFTYHYLYKHLIAMVVGMVIWMLLSSKEQWFDRLGSGLLIGSLGMYAFMMIAPASMVPYTDGKQVILNLGIVSITPAYYYAVGMIWLISWADRNGYNITKVILCIMVLNAVILLYFRDLSMLAVLELVCVAILIGRNGLNTVTIGAVITMILGAGFLISSSEHYMNQLGFMLSHIGSVRLPDGMYRAFGSETFGMIISQIGWIAFFVLIGAYGWLIYRINALGGFSLYQRIGVVGGDNGDRQPHVYIFALSRCIYETFFSRFWTFANHRIFYYDGNDIYEPKIKSYRRRMNRILLLSLFCSLSVFAAENIQTTLKKLDSECTKGNYESCAKIANIYDDADLVKYDPHKALKYWDKACNGAIAESCYALGLLYDEGTYGKNKVVIDEAKATSAFKKGCDVGHQDCCDQIKNRE